MTSKPAKYNVIIAGGGTGGHLYPGLTVAEVLRNHGYNVIFVSRGNDFERREVPKAGFELKSILIEGVKGRGKLNKLAALLKIPVATVQALGLMLKYRPKVVIGLGSYAAGPVVLAAWLMRRPVALMEQNAVPGVTNRMCARFAKKIFITFAESQKYFDKAKCVLAGNPVRQGFLDFALEDVAVSANGPIVIIGGSQGAHSMNELLMQALPHIDDKDALRVVHQTGPMDVAAAREAYAQNNIAATVEAFFDNVPELYREASFVVCRSGATTIAELTIMGKAALFIPFPGAADAHQEKNAEVMVKAGAALMARESELDGVKLAGLINGLRYLGADERMKMQQASKALGKPHAAQDVAIGCLKLMK